MNIILIKNKVIFLYIKKIIEITILTNFYINFNKKNRISFIRRKYYFIINKFFKRSIRSIRIFIGNLLKNISKTV
jgi:hypothetical protein